MAEPLSHHSTLGWNDAHGKNRPPTSVVQWDQTNQCACINRPASRLLQEALGSIVFELEIDEATKDDIESELTVEALEGLIKRIQGDTCPDIGDAIIARKCP